MPLILIMGPLVFILYLTMYKYPSKCVRDRSSNYPKPGRIYVRKMACWKKTLIYLLWIGFLTPLALGLGAIGILLVAALAIVPLYILSLIFLVNLIAIACKDKF